MPFSSSTLVTVFPGGDQVAFTAAGDPYLELAIRRRILRRRTEVLEVHIAARPAALLRGRGHILDEAAGTVHIQVRPRAGPREQGRLVQPPSARASSRLTMSSASFVFLTTLTSIVFIAVPRSGGRGLASITLVREQAVENAARMHAAGIDVEHRPLDGLP